RRGRFPERAGRRAVRQVASRPRVRGERGGQGDERLPAPARITGARAADHRVSFARDTITRFVVEPRSHGMTLDAGRIERVLPLAGGLSDLSSPDQPSTPGPPGEPAPASPPPGPDPLVNDTTGPSEVAEPPARILFLDDDPHRAEMFLARYPAAVW